MIGFLRGKVLIVKENILLLDVGGVGYKILAPLPLLLSLSVNEELSIHIHTHV
ncbi:MAG: Holliday junction branch migration protein RuvA, partial [Candidatus Pacebacteria bacterium]|nr:Holliday junction branch migration protein RuvA [Candidatus Paceibacterota bacterium]